ncbi:MAG TPA: LUD domain-containing protein [Solirubrobacteraceae bacterium]|nr:LUD domain-containing protein [Solirubrobacteraceae bacterium]
MTGAAREELLGRVRAALGPSAGPREGVAIPRAYRRAGRETAPGASAVVERFCARVAEYRARVHRARAGELEALVGDLLAGRRVLVPPAPPCAAGVVDALPDEPPLTARELDGADAVLTGCALAIAETGTIVLDGSPACGRRALTLVPDHHVCVVRAEQILADVPAALDALAQAGAATRPITLVSGPSATSDIELERVEGVHGPRTLDVVVVAGSAAPAGA